jgi:hypothetical protein
MVAVAQLNADAALPACGLTSRHTCWTDRRSNAQEQHTIRATKLMTLHIQTAGTTDVLQQR